jgi:excisionase family DNA binding protein
MSSEPERLLKPSEFCRIVGISYRTFKRWVSEGRIRVVRTPTGRIIVPYSEVVKNYWWESIRTPDRNIAKNS